MSEANVELAEIELRGVEDDNSTEFFDHESIPVEHTNFEFEQHNKLQGLHRHLTIFNDTHCYQSIKNKHRRKYKFRIDLAYLDPRPFRVRKTAWKWLCAATALLVLEAALIFSGWFDTSSINFLGMFLGITVVAVMCLLAFFFYSQDRVFFRSQYGKIRLVELINNNPDNESFHSFISKFVMQIKKSQTARGLNQNKFLVSELKELRRLKDETVITTATYEKAKNQIFKHEAFKPSG